MKMEKVLGLAVVSSILCVGSVLGKYVRGIVNTKEVSIMFTFYCLCAVNGSEFSGVLAAHLLVAVINGLLWQMCIHASAFARIWKPDALICFAKIITLAAIEPMKVQFVLQARKTHFKRRMPTFNLHPPIRFYRCVSTEMLFWWHYSIVELQLSHAGVRTDLRLLSCAYKGARVCDVC